jgi:hypothetical protein
MATSSTSCALMEREQVQVFNEVLGHENIDEISKKKN